MKLQKGKKYPTDVMMRLIPMYYQAGSSVDTKVEKYNHYDWFEDRVYLGPDGWGREPEFSEDTVMV
jgi:hypothetical protein